MEETFLADVSASSGSSNDGDIEDADDEVPLAFEQHSAPVADFRFSNAFTPVGLSQVELKSNGSLPTHSVTEFKQVQPLRPEEVRWFYYIKKKKKFRPMIGDDSMRLEQQWRSYHFEKKEPKRVPIRGGMYEADVLQRQCFPIYWSSIDLKSHQITGETIVRGSWFFQVNWHPINEILAETIEQEHEQAIKTVANSGLKHTIQLENCHIEWFSEHDVVFFKDATRHRAFRSIVQKFGVSKVKSGGHRLNRGYKFPAHIEQRYLPISYLVFVIHGIGSKSDRFKIVRNTAEFRSLCNRMRPKAFHERIEFIPVEWRSRVVLDNDLISTVTLPQSQGVRKFVNHTALDILYYTTPLYRKDIVTALRNELNRIYVLFKDKNPDFNGKICLIAHSLGCVILHDILTDWQPSCEVNIPSISVQSSATSDHANQLNFKADVLFCIGCPLGMFLCLRGYQPPSKRPASQDSIFPIAACPRVYNVFHPFDPIAYRIEPLIYPHYTEIPPLVIGSSFDVPVKTPAISKPVKPIPSSVSPSSMATAPAEDFTQEETSLKSPSQSRIQSSDNLDLDSESEPPPPLLAKRSKLRQVAGGAARLLRGDRWKKNNSKLKLGVDHVSEDEDMYPKSGVRAFASPTVSRPVLKAGFAGPKLSRRLDYQLPVGFTERKFGYAAFTSHTSYWFNQDLASFFINQLLTDEQN